MRTTTSLGLLLTCASLLAACAGPASPPIQHHAVEDRPGYEENSSTSPEPEERTAWEPPTEENSSPPPEPPRAPDPRIAQLRTLRHGFQACARDRDGLTPAFARCSCELLCRQRFPAAESTLSLRYPFMDIDGLAFTIEADGRVSTCRYTIGARELADMTCPASSER